MKARLFALVVDLLLDCFTLLIGPDKSPGIAVSTIPELAAALMREDSGIVNGRPSENERSSPGHAYAHGQGKGGLAFRTFAEEIPTRRDQTAAS